jgi:uncharacterized peroxidase-related enzyme
MTGSGDGIAWVAVIGQDVATGALADAYAAVADRDGVVENLYLAMSQTPQVIGPADAHYLALLHNPDNPLEPWLSELVATYVAVLCTSAYATANHGANMRHLHPDKDRADRILAALADGGWETVLSEEPQPHAALVYTRKLTLDPGRMCQDDIAALRRAGFGDKAISYIAQIAAAFAYWSRITNGLGIRLGSTVGIMGAPSSGTDPG